MNTASCQAYSATINSPTHFLSRFDLAENFKYCWRRMLEQSSKNVSWNILQYYSQYNEIVLNTKEVHLSHTLFVIQRSKKIQRSKLVCDFWFLVSDAHCWWSEWNDEATCLPPRRHKSRLIISRILSTCYMCFGHIDKAEMWTKTPQGLSP